MRSIVIILKRASREEVAGKMAEMAVTVGADWRYPSVDETTLYVRFYDELESEADRKDLEKLILLLGRKPDVAIIADVSGRVDGRTEVQALAQHLLGNFDGVARDDYSEHYWTLNEIKSGFEFEGHAFFDHDGWYDERQGV